MLWLKSGPLNKADITVARAVLVLTSLDPERKDVIISGIMEQGVWPISVRARERSGLVLRLFLLLSYQ